MKKEMTMTTTIGEKLGITNYPFLVNDSKGNEIYHEDVDNETGERTWERNEYDSDNRLVFSTNSNGFFEEIKYEGDYWNKKGYYYLNDDTTKRLIYMSDSDGFRYVRD